MGQIIGGAAKPKRCNLNKLSRLGTPAAGEYILVSSDNSMNAAGQGNFDCYIVGNGTKAATALKRNKINGDIERKILGLCGIDITNEHNYTEAQSFLMFDNISIPQGAQFTLEFGGDCKWTRLGWYGKTWATEPYWDNLKKGVVYTYTADAEINTIYVRLFSATSYGTITAHLRLLSGLSEDIEEVRQQVDGVQQNVTSVVQSTIIRARNTQEVYSTPVNIKAGDDLTVSLSSETLVMSRLIFGANTSAVANRIGDVSPNASEYTFSFHATSDISTLFITIISSSPNNDDVSISIGYGWGMKGKVVELIQDNVGIKENVQYFRSRSFGISKDDFTSPCNVYSSPSGSVTVNSNRSGSPLVEVSQGDEFFVYVPNTSSVFSVVALDTNKNIVLSESVAGTANQLYKVKNASVKYLYFCTNSVNTAFCRMQKDITLFADEHYDSSIFTISGKFIGTSGSVSNSASYSMTEPIDVNVGDVIFTRNIKAATSVLMFACHVGEYGSIVSTAKSLVGAGVSADYFTDVRNAFVVPEGVTQIQISAYNPSDVNVNIIRVYNHGRYILEQRGNDLIDNFSKFDNLTEWTMVSDRVITSPTKTNAWSITKHDVDYSEDDCCLCCQITPLSFNDSLFEAGIGKTTHNRYTGVTIYATLAKDGNGSYLKVYQYNYNTSQYDEVTGKRVTLTEEIATGKEYFVKIVKKTNTASEISIYALNSEGAIIGETSSDNYQFWGAATCMIYNGSAQFENINFSYPKLPIPCISVVGDSFVEGGTMSTKTNRWVGMLKTLVGEKNCIVMGRGGASLLADNVRLFEQIRKCNAAYVILESVANDDSFSYWLAGLQILLRLCEANNATPILTTYTPLVNASSAAISKMNSVNEWVRNSGYKYLDINKALSDDGVTYKEGYYLPDGVHPSQAGHLAIFNRLKVDCPYLLGL